MRNHLLVLAFSSSLGTFAQITLQTTVPERLWGLHSLHEGHKLFATNATGFVIYDPDLTVFRTFTYPAPPVGYNYTMMPFYITSSLFDDDASNFECIIGMQNGAILGMRILREDGTILFEDLTHGIVGGGAGDGFSSYEGIINTENGTIMLLSTGPAGGPTYVYHLPGTLPCFDCNGISTGIAPEGPDADPSSPGAVAYPNPTNGTVRFTCTVPAGMDHVTLQVTDAAGRLVRTAPMQGSGTVELDMADQAAGNYLYQLTYDNGRSTAKQLLVIGAGR